MTKIGVFRLTRNGDYRLTLTKQRLMSITLAFCLALGLTTGAWAADGLSGQSYTVSDGVIRLFAPQGYEGTETIALPSDYCGHTGHSVTWTVQDGKGILK